MRYTLPQITFLTSLLFLLFVTSGCGMNDEEPNDDNYPDGNLSGTISLYIQGKNNDSTTPYPLLGKGFDLLNVRNIDIRGIKQGGAVLDLDRINNSEPWNPFVDQDSRLSSNSSIRIDLIKRSNRLRTVNARKEYKEISQLNIPTALTGKIFSLALDNSSNSDQEKGYGYVELSAYKIKRTVSLAADHNEYAYYLTESFAKDLKELEGDELLKKYGTHILSSYLFGSVANIIVKYARGNFSEKEALSFAQSLASKEPAMSLVERFLEKPNGVEVWYTQSGSSYEPSLDKSAVNKKMFENGGPLRMDLWEEGLNDEYDGFVPNSDATIENSLLFIPELISYLPLKVKYLSAILHHLTAGKVTYLLSDPYSYKPVMAKNNYYLYLQKERYNSGTETLFSSAKEGDEGIDHLISPHSISADEQSQSTLWKSKLHSNGLWTISIEVEDNIVKYLCNDLQLRTVEEDQDSKRFWGLNPIMSFDSGEIDYTKYYVQ